MFPQSAWKTTSLARVRTAQLVPVFAALLTPAAVMSAVLGIWRLGADLKWTGDFAIADGLFSHWQVWIALAVGIRMGASHFKAGRGNHRHG